MKTAATGKKTRSRRTLSKTDRFTLSAFVGIPTLLQILLLWVPAVVTIVLSFTYWNGIRLSDIRWAGIQNYKTIFFNEPLFYEALKNNGVWLAFFILVATPLGILLAYQVDRGIKGHAFYESIFYLPVVLSLAVIGIIYGAIAATMQTDLKRLVAYSSVAHLGFIVLGIFAITSQSLTGSVMQMVNHGISTGALFLLVGMIYERRHTREIAELRGIQSVAPIFSAAFMIVMLSSIGVPGLNGFAGEFLILIGSFQSARWWTIVAATGVILAALYLLWAYQRVFHGEPDEANSTFAELTLREGALLMVFIGLIGFTGIYPKPMLERIEPSIDKLMEHVVSHSDYKAPTTPEVKTPEEKTPETTKVEGH